MANSVFVSFGNQVIIGPTTFTSPVYLADGTAAAPSLAFASAPTKGWFMNGSGTWGLANGSGSATINLDPASGDINASVSIRAKSNTAYFSLGGSSDVILKWIAAGQLGIQKDSTHGVTLDMGTDGTLKVYNRAGTTQFMEAGILGGNGYIQGNGGNPLLYLADTYIQRIGANVLALGPTTGVALNFATANTLKVFAIDGTSAATLNTAALVTQAAVKTTTYTIDAAGKDYLVVGNHATVAFTITLVAASTNAGRILVFKNIGAAVVTLDATGLGQMYYTSLVNTLALNNGDSVTLVSDGTRWVVV